MLVALEISEPIHPHHKQWPPHKQWTRDECAALQRAGLIAAERYELIEGELIQQNWQEPPPYVDGDAIRKLAAQNLRGNVRRAGGVD